MWLKFSIFCLITLNLSGYKALVVVPVADLMGEPTSSFNANHSIYFSQPYSPETGQFCCTRIYQALFNEIVEVLQEIGPKENIECRIRYLGAAYLKDGALCSEFYTLKKFLMPLKNLDINTIPAMPSLQQSAKSFNPNDISLKDNFDVELGIPKSANISQQAVRPDGAQRVEGREHYFQSKLNNAISFSAGTRFRLYKENKNRDYHEVYYLNKIIKIPKILCVKYDPSLNYKERVKLFVKILKQWANSVSGFIPYTLGGSSMAYKLNHDHVFELVTDLKKSHWDYPQNSPAIKSGMDCSALIMRAAQIAGIPLFYRNTATMEKYLKDISDYDYHIEVGDIIWFKGHVIVISDIENSYCIESRGYSGGYGRVQEIELCRLFKNINNFEDLKNALKYNKTLGLISKDGKISSQISCFKILKLRSIF